LEQKEANGKGKKATIFEENGAADPPWVCRMVIGSTTGPTEVNVGSAYPDERQKHWEPQCGGHEKDISGGQEVADDAQDPGRRKATDRGEALIATKPFSERLVPNEPQTDSGDRRPEDASGHAL
jgi:hypothetical protein